MNSTDHRDFIIGPIDGVVIRDLACYRDDRGWLIELYRNDELSLENHPRMAYVSETEPGITRGPHEHHDQSDCFAFIGPGELELYLWDARFDSATLGHCQQINVGEKNRRLVIVPPGVVHAYKNVGIQVAWVFNAPNRLYAGEGKRHEVDEIRHEDHGHSPYITKPCQE